MARIFNCLSAHRITISQTDVDNILVASALTAPEVDPILLLSNLSEITTKNARFFGEFSSMLDASSHYTQCNSGESCPTQPNRNQPEQTLPKHFTP